MNKAEQISELVTALAKAQGVMQAAKKDSKNPFFKSSYADLASVWEVCRKPLSDNGLSVTQLVSQSEGAQTLETILFHSSGQWIASNLTLYPKDDSPQAIGSAITYARRYALSALVGVAAEDDDGESATAHEPPSPVAHKKPSPATTPAKSPAVAQNARPVASPTEAGPPPFLPGTPAPAAPTGPETTQVNLDDLAAGPTPGIPPMPEFANWGAFWNHAFREHHIAQGPFLKLAAGLPVGTVAEAWDTLMTLVAEGKI